MAQLNLVAINGVLLPSLAEDEAKLKTLKRGEVVQVDFKKPRNHKFHRKFFALLQIVVEFDPRYDNVEQVLHLMKLKLGYFLTVINTDGRVTYQTKSISFASMDQTDFEIFYNDAVNKVISDFVPKWEASERWSLEEIINVTDHVLRF